MLGCNYKIVVGNNNNRIRTGRKIFEFGKKFDEIFHRKTNITPECLFSPTSHIMEKPAQNLDEQVQVWLFLFWKFLKTQGYHKIKLVSVYKKRNDILTVIKNDKTKIMISKICTAIITMVPH